MSYLTDIYLILFLTLSTEPENEVCSSVIYLLKQLKLRVVINRYSRHSTDIVGIVQA